MRFWLRGFFWGGGGGAVICLGGMPLLQGSPCCLHTYHTHTRLLLECMTIHTHLTHMNIPPARARTIHPGTCHGRNSGRKIELHKCGASAVGNQTFSFVIDGKHIGSGGQCLDIDNFARVCARLDLCPCLRERASE